MIPGRIAFKTPWPGSFFPEKNQDSESQSFLQRLRKDKSAIPFSQADQAWYCEECKKVLALLSTEATAWFQG
ncbi:MAG: hypothetical protein GX849_00540 [Clostridiaceae bacterium]|jgi:hypothetical protein|nr:hypothetical protein [Clostridiaceae bacterium]